MRIRVAAGALLAAGTAAASPIAPPVPLPACTATAAADWLNSAPLRVADLRGQVLLLDVWTFDCWNCYRSFPWLRDLERRLADEPFRVIGIHSPEFAHERVAAAVARTISEFQLHHPVMLDHDFAYWRALNKRYWPAFYLVDKQGRLRFVHVGETHVGAARAKRIAADLRTLLAE